MRTLNVEATPRYKSLTWRPEASEGRSPVQWSSNAGPPGGTVFTDFLGLLNTSVDDGTNPPTGVLPVACRPPRPADCALRCSGAETLRTSEMGAFCQPSREEAHHRAFCRAYMHPTRCLGFQAIRLEPDAQTGEDTVVVGVAHHRRLRGASEVELDARVRAEGQRHPRLCSPAAGAFVRLPVQPEPALRFGERSGLLVRGSGPARRGALASAERHARDDFRVDAHLERHLWRLAGQSGGPETVRGSRQLEPERALCRHDLHPVQDADVARPDAATRHYLERRLRRPAVVAPGNPHPAGGHLDRRVHTQRHRLGTGHPDHRSANHHHGGESPGRPHRRAVKQTGPAGANRGSGLPAGVPYSSLLSCSSSRVLLLEMSSATPSPDCRVSWNPGSWVAVTRRAGGVGCSRRSRQRFPWPCERSSRILSSRHAADPCRRRSRRRRRKSVLRRSRARPNAPCWRGARP